MKTSALSGSRLLKIGYHFLALVGLSLMLALAMYLNEGGSDSRHSFLTLFLQAGTGVLFNLAPPVYINLLWLIPLCLEKKRYVLYGVGMVVTVVGWGAFISQFEPWADRNWFGEQGESQSLGVGIGAMVMLMAVTTFLNLSYRWFRQLATVKQMEHDRLQMELTLLKDQINPHFLFNTLNNLYALALEESKDTPGMILKLAEMMRYAIYDCKEKVVSIGDEIDYIQNYIELQEIRRQSGQKVSFEHSVSDRNLGVAPMILIVFVENAFKHGFETVRNADIQIALEATSTQIRFQIENRWNNSETATEYKGLGLENVKKRLELEYPDTHQLTIVASDDRFTVNLNIDIAV